PAREPRRRPRRRRRGGARAEGLSLQASLSRPVILRSGATKDLRPMCRWPHRTSDTPELVSCGNLRFLRSAQDGRTGEGWRPRRLARPGACTIFSRKRARRAAAGPYLVDSPPPPSLTLRTALAAGLLLAAPLASAQKPAERSPLEVGQDYVEVTSRAGSDLLVAADGTPRAIYLPNYAVRPAEPEAMARQYLAENAALLRLDPTLDDLALRAVREGLAGTTVRFTQTVRGVPVYGPDLVVSIDRQHRVQFVLSPYRPGLTLPAARPAVTDAEARALVGEHLDAQAPFQLDETSLVVYPMPDGARLAWLVRLVPTSPIGDWEALVDAADGTFLRVADRAINERGEDPPAIPAVAALAYPRAVNGTGYVFYPDPLTRAGVPYGTPGYTDNGDADSPELTAARSF